MKNKLSKTDEDYLDRIADEIERASRYRAMSCYNGTAIFASASHSEEVSELMGYDGEPTQPERKSVDIDHVAHRADMFDPDSESVTPRHRLYGKELRRLVRRALDGSLPRIETIKEIDAKGREQIRHAFVLSPYFKYVRAKLRRKEADLELLSQETEITAANLIRMFPSLARDLELAS